MSDSKAGDGDFYACEDCKTITVKDTRRTIGGYYYCPDCAAKVDKTTEEAIGWIEKPLWLAPRNASYESVLEQLNDQSREQLKIHPRERAKLALACAKAVNKFAHKGRPFPCGFRRGGEGNGFVDIKPLVVEEAKSVKLSRRSD